MLKMWMIIATMRLIIWWSIWMGPGYSGYIQRMSREIHPYLYQTTKVIKLPSDNNQYELIKLDNGLEALIISNPKLVRASAAINVKVGSRDDPKEARGLAHLCEHLLFLGNDKYPDRDDFIKFIKSSAGLYNAYTSLDETGYYFELTADRLEDGLEKFSNLFIKPEFDSEVMSNEVDIVDQEFRSKIMDDSIRYWYAMKSTGSDHHPFKDQFQGSMATLNVTAEPDRKKLKTQLKDFFKHHYTADIMKLVVIGKEPAEELIEMVVSKFRTIPNHVQSSKISPKHGDPFPPNDNNKLIKLVPIKDESKLLIAFKIDNQDNNYRSKPSLYLENALCQSNTGSIISKLKASQLAYNISCGITDHYSDFGIFEIEYALTLEGEGQVDHIVNRTLRAIKTIKDKFINQEIFHQFKKDLQSIYNFYRPDIIHEIAVEYSRVLQLNFPPQLILSVDYLLFDYSEKSIKEFLMKLNYDNMRVTLMTRSNGNLPNLVEDPHFGTLYTVKSFNATTIQSLKHPVIMNSLKLPDSNQFLPSRFEILKEPIYKKPKFIKDLPNGKLVHHNRHFNLPKAVIKTAVWNRRAAESVIVLRDHVQFQLLREIIALSLYDDNYNNDFQLAGYDYDIQVYHHSLRISLSGFSDQIHNVQEHIISRIKRNQKLSNLYSICQSNFIKRNQNQLYDPLLDQARQIMRYALNLDPYKITDMIETAQTITQDDMTEFIRRLFNRGSLKVLVEGNLSEKDADGIYKSTLLKLGLHKLEDIKESLYTLPSSFNSTASTHLYRHNLPPSITDSAIGYYLHLYSNHHSDNYRALTLILRSIMVDHLYTFVRLDSHMSYQFKVEEMILGDMGGGILILLESKYDSGWLELQIEKFLLLVKDRIERMDPAHFEFKQRVIQRELEGHGRNLESLSNLHWTQLLEREANFEEVPRLIAALRELCLRDLIDFTHDRVHLTSPHRHKLSVHLLSSSEPTPEPDLPPSGFKRAKRAKKDFGIPITDLKSWRAAINY